MGIAALLMALGIAGFISTRDQAIVNDTTEKILSEIREAQTRSIAVKNDGANNTIAWALELNATKPSASLVAYNNTAPGVISRGTATPLTINPGVRITTKSPTTSIADGGVRNIVFSTPFADTQTFTTPLAWTQRTVPPFNWSNGANQFTNTYNQISIIIDINGGLAQTIIVKNNGDAYVQ